MPGEKTKYILSKNLILEIEGDFEGIILNREDKTKTLVGEDEENPKQVLLNYFYNKAHDVLVNALMAENILILAGAGASMCDGGPDRSGLWKKIVEKLTEEKLKEIKNTIGFPADSEDAEAFLSRIELYLDLNPSDKTITKAKLDIINTVVEVCDLKSEAANHQKFLKAVLSASARANSSRPKIFTTNYDMEFETAAQKIGAISLDGFSFHSSPSFDGKYFDYDLVVRKGSRIPETDNFIPSVLHLYKLHGSLDWIYSSAENVIDKAVIKKAKPDEKDERVLIYPSRNKFERSYAKPYFELMSRFQSELRKKTPTTLLIIGYGFGDEHINSMIKEAVLQQQNLRIVIVNGTIDKSEENDMLTFLKNKGVGLGTTFFLNLKFANPADSKDEIKTLVDLIPSMEAFKQAEAA